jgi:hypothetical protein
MRIQSLLVVTALVVSACSSGKGPITSKWGTDDGGVGSSDASGAGTNNDLAGGGSLGCASYNNCLNGCVKKGMACDAQCNAMATPKAMQLLQAIITCSSSVCGQAIADGGTAPCPNGMQGTVECGRCFSITQTGTSPTGQRSDINFMCCRDQEAGQCSEVIYPEVYPCGRCVDEVNACDADG